MHSIIVTEQYEGRTIEEIISLYSEEIGINIPISECLVILDEAILDFDQLSFTVPLKGQKISVFRLAAGG